MHLNVILSKNQANLGIIDMRVSRYQKLAAFDDHVNKPINLMLTDGEIQQLREQNPADIAAGPAFLEDDEITLEPCN